MKAFVKGLMAAALATTAAPAFAAEDTPFRCEPGEKYVMNVMVSGVEYWFPVYEMFKQAAQQFGCETEYTGTPAYDITQQLASFEQVLAKKPAGIMVHPMNSDPFIEPINRAVDGGIPVVTFAADSPNSKRISYITSDNVREGTFVADAIAEAMGGKGEYAVLENPGQDNHDLRISAFISRMEDKYPDMKLVARAATNQDPTKAYNSTLSMIQAHPNLGAIWMPEASSALGAAQAVEESGKDIKIANADVNGKILDLIKEGKIFASVNPNQGAQGYWGFMLLWMAAHPELIDPMNDHAQTGFNPMGMPVVDNGFSIITAEIADNFYWDAYLKRRGTKGINE
ncbi:transporter [Actibacterium mucosum KCTC 23349]|uniref:Transporter n=1 Tax=Actibacterium mucosum KCTC 23349 TaxID=1454373 RepID=A0A037ZGS0_9RHOB|nr:substrate-binding domain-containing protein [Actibacterium mucosum]KAJ54736.1 transporter [Actibacterium mucosum KCTC 23349]